MGEKPSFVTPETMREAAETETAVISSEAPENVPEETALMETEEADAPAYKVLYRWGRAKHFMASVLRFTKM